MGAITTNSAGSAAKTEVRSKAASAPPAESKPAESGVSARETTPDSPVGETVTLTTAEEETENRQVSDMLNLRDYARQMTADRAARAEAWMAGPNLEPGPAPDPEVFEAARAESRQFQHENQMRTLERFNEILSGGGSGTGGGTYESPTAVEPPPSSNLTAEQRLELVNLAKSGAGPMRIYSQQNHMIVSNMLQP